ncbi:MAG: hypothetical protein ACTSSP_05765 [Candidatus Asgardarchaeia archaeon]
MQKDGIKKLLSPYFFPILVSIGGIILGIPLYDVVTIVSFTISICVFAFGITL